MKMFLAGLAISLLLSVSGDAQMGGGQWQTLAPMPSARQEIATAVLNGKGYVIAGFNAGGASTSTVESYNPATNTWASVQSIPIENNHSNAALGGKTL